MLSPEKVKEALGASHPVTSDSSLGPGLVDPLTSSSAPTSTPAPRSIKERAADLSGHVDKLAGERKSLAKWNNNGDGRNQGLVHVVDYAHARPAASVKGKYGALEEGSNLEDTIGRGALPGSAIAEKLSTKGVASKDFSKFADANLSPLRKDDGKGARLTRSEETDSDETRGELADIDKAIADAKKEKANAIQIVPLKDRGAWAKKEGLAFTNKIARLEKLALDRTMYTVPREESKKGRVQTVERAMDAAPGAYKGDEINQVTNALDTLKGAPTSASTTKTQNGAPKNLGQQLGKVGTNTNGRAKWDMVDTTINDVSSSSTMVGGSDAQKVKAHTWGPTVDSEKYSTVMGA